MAIPMPRGGITTSVTRIFHERFCCNRGFAAATSRHESCGSAAASFIIGAVGNRRRPIPLL